MYSSGLHVFNIDPVGGIISSPTVTAGPSVYSYLDTVDRSVIIGANIYALAHRSVSVAGSADLALIKNVILPESYGYIPVDGVGLPAGGIAVPLAP